MIYAPLKYADRYRALSPRIAAALDFLNAANFAALADGHYELEGDKLYVNVMSYESKPENSTPEHHKRYADLQYIISGQETIAVLPLDHVGALVKDMSDSDCWLYEGEAQPVTLAEGEFMLLFPEDAHAPGISPSGTPEPVRKAVVKICLD